ncbi:hypothetical protein EG850_08470 [Gulosibacter macacae]|uniref:Dynamin N-terminal domain-containing protein n=1 Tax=Gulosibacter macacae TaxID=2488791 RepID=A0A3P3VV87_9MICO|nr:dynamin family protein [Gulosibacter macacae]RRJ86374.1 hypothetical protein EG850_08470 [Gulosibacter macacae]
MTTDAASAPGATPPAAAKPPNPATVAFRSLGTAAKSYGLQQQFAAIARMVKDSRGKLPSIVVVGEMNRGKSTLVNALLAQARLAPAGPAEMTALAVNYTPASEAFPLGQAELEYASEPKLRRIPATHLDQWIRLDSPTLLNAEEAPLQASLAVRPGFVQNCVIVDTPGAGGLSEAYALRALTRARDASVLLVVTDATGRITVPALDFLERCSTQVESVVIAVTKIDLYQNNWQQIVDENREVIAQRLPRLANAPVIGVSGAWGERASAEHDPARRQRLFEASRIPELAAALRAPLERANQLPTLNALRQGIGLLSRPLEKLQAERVALSGDDAEHEAKHKELVELRKHREELMRTFEDSRYDWNAQVDRVRVDLTAANSRLVREFGAAWRQKVQSKGTGLGAKQVLVLQNELAADLEVNVNMAMRGIAERSGQLLNELYSAAGMDPHRTLFGEVERRANEAGQAPRGPIEQQAASLDPRTLFSGFIMGSGIGGLALGALLGPVGAALIGMSVMGSLGTLLARRQAKRQSFLQTVGDATIELREILDRAVRGVLQVVSTDAKKVFDRDLRASANEAKAELDRLESARRASESERAKRIKQLEPRIADLEKVIAQADAEVRRLVEAES